MLKWFIKQSIFLVHILTFKFIDYGVVGLALYIPNPFVLFFVAFISARFKVEVKYQENWLILIVSTVIEKPIFFK